MNVNGELYLSWFTLKNQQMLKHHFTLSNTISHPHGNLTGPASRTPISGQNQSTQNHSYGLDMLLSRNAVNQAAEEAATRGRP